MNNEEKLKEAKRLYKTATPDQKYVLESLFPELKEPEDEKIRKWLIDWAKAVNWSEQFTVTKEQVLAWLEKQGEKKVSYTTIVETGDGGINALVTRELPTDGEQKPIEWKDSDEKYLFWALLSIQKDIAASEINGVNTKDLNDCVKWLYSLKQRIGG